MGTSPHLKITRSQVKCKEQLLKTWAVGEELATGALGKSAGKADCSQVATETVTMQCTACVRQHPAGRIVFYVIMLNKHDKKSES